MLRTPDVSLLVSEPDGPEKLPHALPRVTLAGVARRLDPDDPHYASARQTYERRFPEAPQVLRRYGMIDVESLEVALKHEATARSRRVAQTVSLLRMTGLLARKRARCKFRKF